MSLFDDEEPGDACTLYEVDDRWMGRRCLLVAEDDAQAHDRARRLHRDFESVELTLDVFGCVRLRDVPRLRLVTARWVKGFRFQPRQEPKAGEASIDYVRVRRLGPLDEPWKGPMESAWPEFANAGAWQPVDIHKGMRPVIDLGQRWARS